MQTDATVSIEPIPIDSEGLAFDGDAGQDDKSHLSDGVHGFSGGVGYLTRVFAMWTPRCQNRPLTTSPPEGVPIACMSCGATVTDRAFTAPPTKTT